MRLFTITCALMGAVLAGCGGDEPMSSSQPQEESPAAKLTVSAFPVAGLAEKRPTTFRVLVENVAQPLPYSASGAFNTPVGASGPGPLLPGSSYEFSFAAAPGARLSFATMYVQSNDLFFAPDDEGLALWADGAPISGDITAQIHLWDAGTETNQEPGVGPDQAPRQSGPDSGADESGDVRLVDDGFDYGEVDDLITVTITPDETATGTHFTVTIANDDDSNTPLAPGAWVVHADGMPLFADGEADMGDGLEDLAEDGNPGPLADALGMETGVTTVLAPGIWVVHADGMPLFVDGEADMGGGLEGLAEDGNPGPLADALGMGSGVFNTPVDAAGPGPVPPGGAYEFTFRARPGDRLSFATMFVQSNDLFFAPDDEGIDLFATGRPARGDITAQIYLWDAGTEVNQVPGVGPDQAPRQSGPDSGADESGDVRLVDDGFHYPDVEDAIRVTISAR